MCIQFYIIYSWEVFFFVCAKLPYTNYLPKKICNLCWIDIWSYVISFGINLLLLIPSRIRNCKISIRNCQYNAGIGNILKYNLWSCISQTFDVSALVRNTINILFNVWHWETIWTKFVENEERKQHNNYLTSQNCSFWTLPCDGQVWNSSFHV